MLLRGNEKSLIRDSMPRKRRPALLPRCLTITELTQPVLVSRDIGIRGGCVGPHDVTTDHPARARVAEGEDGDAVPHREGEGDDDDGGRAAPADPF